MGDLFGKMRLTKEDHQLIEKAVTLNARESVADKALLDNFKRSESIERFLRLVEPDSVEESRVAEEQMREISRCLQRPWVYFVSAGKRGPIKIGCSRSPLRRIAEIQSHHFMPLKILCICISENERELHREFAELRLHGEWFAHGPELRNRIAKIIREARSHRALTTVTDSRN